MQKIYPQTHHYFNQDCVALFEVVVEDYTVWPASEMGVLCGMDRDGGCLVINGLQIKTLRLVEIKNLFFSEDNNLIFRET